MLGKSFFNLLFSTDLSQGFHLTVFLNSFSDCTYVKGEPWGFLFGWFDFLLFPVLKVELKTFCRTSYHPNHLSVRC